MSVAAGVTYYALLALFPAIGALVSIYGLFADPATIQDHLNVLSGVLPAGALEVVGEQVKRISSQGGGTLGLGFVIGLAVSLWSANAGMKAIFDALNIVYEEEEGVHVGRHSVPPNCPRLRDRPSCCSRFRGSGGPSRVASHVAALAGALGGRRGGPCRYLSVWPQPWQGDFAVDYARQHRCRCSLACRFDVVLLVRG
jgi:hypothetical protein